VIGELALGHLSQRREVVGLLASLPQATVATTNEILTLVERHQLYGLGVGYIDAQVLRHCNVAWPGMTVTPIGTTPGPSRRAPPVSHPSSPTKPGA
jgi:hypothetical protein